MWNMLQKQIKCRLTSQLRTALVSTLQRHFVHPDNRGGKTWSRIKKGIFSRSMQSAAAWLRTSVPFSSTSPYLIPDTAWLSLEEPWWWSSPCPVRQGCCTLILPASPSVPGAGAWLALNLPVWQEQWSSLKRLFVARIFPCIKPESNNALSK